MDNWLVPEYKLAKFHVERNYTLSLLAEKLLRIKLPCPLRLSAILSVICMMARIQYCSDLHLEFPRNRAFLDKNPLEAKADILILAGDIVPFSAMNRLTDFWDELSEKFEHTFWVPGNHEYYHSDIGDRTGEVYEEIRENIFLVNNYVTKIDNVKLIFSTLWTALSETYQFQVQRIMADFKVIQHGKTLLSPAVYNRLHLENLEFLEKAIAGIQADEKVVVSTHHVPTFMNYPEKYRGDFLNEAFAVELFELIADNPIDHWIFGHHHCNTPTFQIGNTDMRTNQLGYVHIGENEGFDSGKYFEL